jgi:hypothetical protein
MKSFHPSKEYKYDAIKDYTPEIAERRNNPPPVKTDGGLIMIGTATLYQWLS